MVVLRVLIIGAGALQTGFGLFNPIGVVSFAGHRPGARVIAGCPVMHALHRLKTCPKPALGNRHWFAGFRVETCFGTRMALNEGCLVAFGRVCLAWGIACLSGKGALNQTFLSRILANGLPAFTNPEIRILSFILFLRSIHEL